MNQAIARWTPLFVAVAATATYAGALYNGFTYDDEMVVRDAELLLSHASMLPALVGKEYFLFSHESTYRPLVTLSYFVDYQLGELGPFVYHLQSVLWHAACAVLVVLLARRLAPKSRELPLIAGLFFAVHPVATEAIDNISFREDPIATALLLAALVLVLREPRFSQLAALPVYALALLAKESALVAPLLFGAARLWVPAVADRRRALRGAIAFAAVAALYALIRFGPMAGPPEYAEYPGGALWPTLVGMGPVLLRYLRLLVLPWRLCADYSGVFDFSGRWNDSTIASWLVLAAFSAAVLWMLRRRWLSGFGLLWFLIALAPVSNVIAIPVPAAERFLYLPLVGVALAAGAAAEALYQGLGARARDLAALGGVLIGLILVVGTMLRHPTWHDNGTLWRQTVRDFPASWGARHGLGVQLKQDGDLADAARELEIALRSGPSESARSSIEVDLGIVYGMQGRLDESLAVLKMAVARRPLAKSYFNLGVTLARMGDPAGATLALSAALKHDPYYAKPYALLAELKLRQGDVRSARELLSRAVELSPHDAALAARLQALDRR